MADTLNGRPGTNFWIVSGVALIWNLIGLVFYYLEVTATPEALATLTEAQQNFLANKPSWATSAFAIAVTTGVLGSLLLLLRKALALPMFIISLAGIVVQNLHAFGMADGLEAWGTSGVILPTITIIVAIALILYARAAQVRGWIA
ncbi:MAG: hypothetical protein OEO82_05340 [Gammaproteobacteria bacterium]|nr:hypothetical protein [Gammaproteobacteria bacterium]